MGRFQTLLANIRLVKKNFTEENHRNIIHIQCSLDLVHILADNCGAIAIIRDKNWYHRHRLHLSLELFGLNVFSDF